MESVGPAPAVTFAVADVKPATRPLPQSPYDAAVRAALRLPPGAALESWSQETAPLVRTSGGHLHAFALAVSLADALHHPLILSPDMVWLLLAQGAALHVNAHGERLRPRLVRHAGKVKIVVRRDEFVRGFAGNDWEGVFGDFSEQIRGHAGDAAHGLFIHKFSTTGRVERAAMEVTLMDAVQSFFEYEVHTLCGIPSVTLEGTPDDWRALRTAAEGFTALDLKWWTRHLLPVLDQFIVAAEGRPDAAFWRSFWKEDGMSGGPYITGHAMALFPYLTQPFQAGKPFRNPYMGRVAQDDFYSFGEGATTDQFPSGLAAAPFFWEYYGDRLPMRFVAGFVGVRQDPDTLALRPEIGWAVQDARAPRKPGA